MSKMRDIVIVGGGLAGLNCARLLLEHGRTVLILEQDERPGGRVQTDNVEGFLLDRGFQVLLTAYPEAAEVLNYQTLDLHSFFPGALIRYNGKFERLADPWRKPLDALRTITSPIGTLADKPKIATIRNKVRHGSAEDLFNRPETSTLNYLRNAGLSQHIIDFFFAPFFGGIFLDRSLRTSNRMFEFVFRMMAEGSVVIPRGGMGSIPAQLAAAMPQDTIRTGSRVVSVNPGKVVLESGEEIAAEHVVVAVDGPSSAELVSGVDTVSSYVPATNLYFAADRAPMTEPIILLNGDEPGPVNNLVIPSSVSPSYAPSGAALISATVLGTQEDSEKLELGVRHQLRGWFGEDVDGWRHLRTYTIKNALPDQTPPTGIDDELRFNHTQNIYFCGDYLENGSINGALLSGRYAAEEILNH